MIIGIIGYGVVGKAIAQAFESQSHYVKWYDKHIDNHTNYSDLYDCECIFVCVPTQTINGRCDILPVEDAFSKLNHLKFKGLVILKSTVPPGTTQTLIENYPNLKICFVPEFLRQDSALHDFMYSNETLIVGSKCKKTFDFLVDLHAPFYNNAIRISEVEAEVVKYFANNFNSMRVVFANLFYEVCQKVDAEYDEVLRSATALSTIGNASYLKCNKKLRGFGGKCLPKDVEAFNNFIKDLDVPATLLDSIINDNEYYKKK